MPQFVEEVKRRQEDVNALSEQVGELRRTMKAKILSKEMTSAEYQRLWQNLPLRKDVDEANTNLEEFVRSSMKEIFRRGYNTLSFFDVQDFVEKSNK